MINKDVVYIKRVFSVFIIAVLVVMLFAPLTVSADLYDDIADINGHIYIYSGDSYIENLYQDNPSWYLKSSLQSSLTPFQAFLEFIILSGGLTKQVIKADDLQKTVDVIFSDSSHWSLAFVSSAETLMTDWVYCDSLTPPTVGFSADFVLAVEYWLSVFNDITGYDASNPLPVVYDFSGKWYKNVGACVLFYEHYDPYSLGRFFAENLVIESIFDYDVGNSTDLRSLIDDLILFIDMESFTAWLPDNVAAPILLYWSYFTGAVVILVVVKLLHG